MSYWDISSMSADNDLQARITACAAQELPDSVNPHGWAATNMLDFAASPGWSEAWASAVAAGVERPGKDEGVITDGMILAAVQGKVLEEYPPEPEPEPAPR